MYNNWGTGLITVVVQIIEQNRTFYIYIIQRFYLCAINVQYVKSFFENKMETKQSIVIFSLVKDDAKNLHAELVEIRSSYVQHK